MIVRSAEIHPTGRGPFDRRSAPLLGRLALAGAVLVAHADAALAGPGEPPAGQLSAAPGQERAIDYFEIRPHHSRNMCLDVAHASVAHGANVVQGRCWGGTNQHWRLVDVGDGYFEIRAQHSRKCLDVAHLSPDHGANVIQGNCWGGPNQRWRLVEVDDGLVELRPQHSNKCLDVAHASPAHGANVIQGDCWGGANQRWELVHAGTWD